MREFVYAVIRFLFNVVTYLFIGMKVYGEAHIPKTGAVSYTHLTLPTN